MNPDDAHRLFLECLAEVAPEADLAGLPSDADVREELDLDSMDVLEVVAALAERAGMEIPEEDAARLVTVEAAVGYLVSVSAERT